MLRIYSRGKCATRDVHDIQGFGGEPEGRRPLGRPRRRWEKNIEMDLQEVGWGGMDWIDLTWGEGEVPGVCECGNGPLGSTKLGEFLD